MKRSRFIRLCQEDDAFLGVLQQTSDDRGKWSNSSASFVKLVVEDLITDHGDETTQDIKLMTVNNQWAECIISMRMRVNFEGKETTIIITTIIISYKSTDMPPRKSLKAVEGFSKKAW